MNTNLLFTEQPLESMDTLMIHATATPPGMEVTVADVRRWHLQRGFNDIGYNFLIAPDGTISKGRPMDRPGAHAVGHNRTALGIAYVGGVDPDFNPADTRTPQQAQAIADLIVALTARFPQLKRLLGHNQVANKACPCFDVGREYGYLMADIAD